MSDGYISKCSVPFEHSGAQGWTDRRLPYRWWWWNWPMEMEKAIGIWK